MSKLITTVKFLRKPFLFISILGSYRILNWMPDKFFLRIAYRGHTGRWLNIKNPQRFTEKLQWLKLYDRNPLYTQLVDKYEVRNYLKDKIDDNHLVKLYGVYDSFDKINWDELPDSFIMKCTHGCGCNHIVNNKADVDKRALRKQFNKWMKKNPYPGTREWPYKNVKHRIIIEQLLDNDGKTVVDYKFYCFNGKIYCWRSQFYLDGKRYHLYFDLQFNNLNISDSHYPAPKKIAVEIPPYFSEMADIAIKLSEGFPQIRIDFLGTKKQFYMGEFTFFDGSGYDVYSPESFDFDMGKQLIL